MKLEQMIGQRIKEIRGAAGITQEQLSEKAGINVKYLSSIERGRENPTLSTVIKISQALMVNIDQFFIDIQIEDVENRRNMIDKLLEKANDEQLKIAYLLLSTIIK